jgi:hypothetical protein
MGNKTDKRKQSQARDAGRRIDAAPFIRGPR